MEEFKHQNGGGGNLLKHIKCIKFTITQNKTFVGHLWRLPRNQLGILEIVHRTCIHNIKNQETTQMSTCRRMDKPVYSYNGILTQQ
jgi:hypothetical protein